MDDLNFPMKQNINWVAAAGAVAIIFSYFFPGIPENVRDAMLLLAGIGVVLLVSFFHTFVNHRENVKAAALLADKAVAKAKGIVGVLMVFVVLGIGLIGCTTGQPQDPKTILEEIQFGATLAEGAFESICPPAGGGPAFCASVVPNYLKGKSALDAAIATAAAAINLSNDVSTANVAALLSQVEADWEDFNKIVNAAQAEDTAVRGVAHKPVALRN